MARWIPRLHQFPGGPQRGEGRCPPGEGVDGQLRSGASDRTGELAERLRLIVITDRAAAAPRSIADLVEATVTAGAPAVQLRDKSLGARELTESARALLPIVHAAGALLFVNDRLDVAIASGADGVHLGPDDVPVAAARRAAPPGFIIGTSTDDPDQARALVAAGADYIGCGTVYPTSSKADAGSAIGLHGLKRVVEAVSVPVVAIGGVTVDRAEEVAGTGAAGIAAIGSVMSARDPAAAVRALMGPWSV